MPIHNKEIGDCFDQVADLLEIGGANPFRIRAYRQAANTVSRLPRSVAEMLKQGEDLSELPGIGKDLAGKIEEIVRTGKLRLLEDLKRKNPPGITALLQVPSLGPQRVKRLNKELGVNTLADLEKAAKGGRIRELNGFGEKTERRILEELQRTHGVERRFRWMLAKQMTEPFLDYLRKSKKAQPLEIAGSYRRRKDTVGDIDILAASAAPEEVMKRFTAYEDVSQVLAQGETKATVLLRTGLQVDIRVVPEESYGAALLYFTGSKAHNIALRRLAQDRGLKINEYGVFDKKGRRLAGRTEAEIYRLLKMDWIPPELREDRGEIAAAQAHRLPKLVEWKDIRGDLHVHTEASDGRATLEALARRAQEKGYEYLAITDHSPYVGITHGLDAKRLRAQLKAIDRLNGKLRGLRILKGIEVDILEDGSLDLPDEVLKELDLTVGAVHGHFQLSQKKQTERILRAMDHPCFNIFAHPTGRLLGERPPYDVDMERLMAGAKQRGCFLEVNSEPDRMDLDDAACRMAKEMGLRVAVSTDAHALDGLDLMELGVAQARRGWLERQDLLNTLALKDLLRALKRR
ncbi:MAG: DNA polymerase/3'-5' exonuclease PolX [bacterium]